MQEWDLIFILMELILKMERNFDDLTIPKEYLIKAGINIPPLETKKILKLTKRQIADLFNMKLIQIKVSKTLTPAISSIGGNYLKLYGAHLLDAYSAFSEAHFSTAYLTNFPYLIKMVIKFQAVTNYNMYVLSINIPASPAVEYKW